jgi:cysteine dioxygenase
MPGRCELLDSFVRWDRWETPLSMSELVRTVEGLELRRDDLGDVLGFDEGCYRRTVIHARPHYQVLVLCWRSEQRSPIHDHCGSNCVVRVIEGRATETRFARTACGRLVPVWSHEHIEGAVAASCGEEIHQMGNFEPSGHDLITLHLYSPPPSRWRFYEVGETTLADHDLLINKPARTVRIELGHDLPDRPMGSKARGGNHVGRRP